MILSYSRKRVKIFGKDPKIQNSKAFNSFFSSPNGFHYQKFVAVENSIIMRVFLPNYDDCIYYEEKVIDNRKYELNKVEILPEVKYIKYQTCDINCKI